MRPGKVFWGQLWSVGLFQEPCNNASYTPLTHFPRNCPKIRKRRPQTYGFKNIMQIQYFLQKWLDVKIASSPTEGVSSKWRCVLEFLSTLGYLSRQRYPCLSALKLETVTTCPSHTPPPLPPLTIHPSSSCQAFFPSPFLCPHPHLVFW